MYSSIWKYINASFELWYDIIYTWLNHILDQKKSHNVMSQIWIRYCLLVNQITLYQLMCSFRADIEISNQFNPQRFLCIRYQCMQWLCNKKLQLCYTHKEFWNVSEFISSLWMSTMIWLEYDLEKIWIRSGVDLLKQKGCLPVKQGSQKVGCYTNILNLT